MPQTEQRDSDSRGSRELWLNAAYRALVSSGVDAVLIQTLSKELNLSRTSFYWFFANREELLQALLQLWREKNTEGLVRQAAAYSDSVVEAFLNVADCWYDAALFDPRFEFAVRSWALRAGDIGHEIAAADETRIAALSAMLRRYDKHPVSADTRARAIYLTQIGYITMKTVEDMETRMRRIPSYAEIFTGVRPQRRELQRFYSRHGSADEVQAWSKAVILPSKQKERGAKGQKTSDSTAL